MIFSREYGNPSSLHFKGARALNALETARKQISSVMGVTPGEIYFSHSGTLANNTAVFGAAKALRKRGNRIVTTSLEHPSVSRCMDRLESEGFEVIRLAPGEDGAFREEDMFNAVSSGTILVSAMLVNNETGAINPVECIAKAVKAAKAPALIHVDAIQGFMKIPVKPASLGADLVTVSGHKIHAPKGVGALYIKKGVKIPSFVTGGGQEGDMFSGTQPMPAIAAMGAAAEALKNTAEGLKSAKENKALLLSLLKDNPEIRINSPENALPYIINMSVGKIPSQVLINYLSEREIYVSAGSACKKGHRSEVLTNMGFDPARIDSAIRVSLSRFTTPDEIKIFCGAVNDALQNIRTKL